MGECKHFDGNGFCYHYSDNRTKEFCENMCEHNCGEEIEEEMCIGIDLASGPDITVYQTIRRGKDEMQ